MLVKPSTTAKSTRLASNSHLAPSAQCLSHRCRGRLLHALQHARPAACRATSRLLEGPTATANVVGEQLLRSWVGEKLEGTLPVHEETAPLRDTNCNLTVCSTIITAGQRKHVLMAFVITDAASEQSTSRKPGSSGFSVSELPQPVLHWGCAAGKGGGWQAPPPGWSTWPGVSYDARHGAWQTPFFEQQLPNAGPALTLLLQVPWEGPLRHGGLACLVKTSSNKWLGNAATYKDFFFSTSQLPEMPVITGPSAAAAADMDGVVGPEQTLDTAKLAEAAPAPPPQSSSSSKQHKQHHQQHHEKQRHEQEPELPNAGRREREPAFDDTQVCTLSARELRSAAAAQLGAWMQQQPDLELPASGLDVLQHEFPVKGHPKTPFVVATAVLLQRTDSDSSGQGTTQPVLLVAAVGDVGLTGTRKPGLVLQWSGAASPAAATASKPNAVPGSPTPVADLPDGWRTLPDVSWDAGAGFWDTPMSRHLFEGAEVDAMGKLERPASPISGSSSSSQNATPGQLGTAQGDVVAGSMYMALLRLPLQGVFSTGGLVLNMRTSRRQWIRHAETGGPFYLDTSIHLRQVQDLLGPGSQQTSAAAGPAQRLNDAEHSALTAAGLSEDEIVSFLATSMKPAGGAVPDAGAGKGSIAAGKSIDAALSSADQEMQAHIAAQSMSGTGSSRAAAVPGASGPAPKDDLGRFVRDFEAGPIPAEDVLWGLGEPAAASWDPSETPELSPHSQLMKRLADLEHKACRSLMHRYGIAADLVQELLPDLKAAATSAPESLTWPPAADANSSSSGTADKGRAAMAGLVAVTVWLRFSSLRLLVWNHNYNVKPREISAALDRLGSSLVEVYESCPQLSGLALLALASAGRGGEGDMGQRIRDEILAIQHRNGCKGGMMEEWHQKLHNNSSPDDLAICQALLDYLAAGQQQQVYWDSLAATGITPERLASFDRPIRSPPPVFSPQQVPQLTEDLLAYRRTLAAVHSGADLAAAIDGVLGYDAGECKGKRVKVEPLAAVATPKLRRLLSALLMMVQGGSSPSGTRPPSPSSPTSSSSSKVSAMVDMERCLKLQALVVQARHCLAPALRGGNKACQGRLRDVLFLDLALETTGRGALEAGLSAVHAAAPSTLLGGLLAVLQQPIASAAMSALPGQGSNAALVAVLSHLQQLSQECPGLDPVAKARHALSLLERLRSLLAAMSASTTALLQPTAHALAGALGLPAQDPTGPVSLLSEEVVRGSAAAALSLLLTAVEPSLRRLAGVGAWSIVSRLPTSVRGVLSPLTACLSQLPAGAINQPTILVLQRLAGEEEVPPGVVGVIVLGDCPDVLSHCAVRARNARIPVVACPRSEAAQVAHVVGLAGKSVLLSIKGDDVDVSELPPNAQEAAENAAAVQAVAKQVGDLPAAAAAALGATAGPWDGEWVLTVDQFSQGIVGQKAMGTTHLHKAAAAAAATASQTSAARGASSAAAVNSTAAAAAGGLTLLPAWLQLPPSVALPHGSFEAVLQAPLNKDLGERVQAVAARIAEIAAAQPGNTDACAAELEQVRSLVHQLQAPPGLQHALTKHLATLAAAAAANCGAASPSYSWDATWAAITGVWSSQWNTRAVAALGKAGLGLQHLRMGVLLQPLLPARYSWVAHTVNPGSGSAAEVCVQLVVGLGEVLVGNHPGRALGGIIRRDSLTSALQQQQQSSSSSSGHDALALPGEQELLAAVDIVSYPSKDAAVVPVGLQLPCCAGSGSSKASTSTSEAVFMARSDSNAEDLPGFAGAGLFDSVPTAPTASVPIDYAKEPVIWDKAAASALLWQCALAAVTAEQVLQQQEQQGGESNGHNNSTMQHGLDVEGCITPDGRMWLLQARPQV